MPLLDHFHPPVSDRRPWSGFHALWAGTIATRLNATIPAGFFAQPSVHFGIEVDVAAWDEGGLDSRGGADAGHRWAETAPTATVPFVTTTDEVEVQVFATSGGLTLAGAIELVSPANKARPAHRDAFNAKCEALLHARLGLIVVDVVTDRLANLHEELLARLDRRAAPPEGKGVLSATSYRPGPGRLDIWCEVLHLQGDLPELPLWLHDGPCLTVDLEGTYAETLRALNFPTTW